MEHVKNLICALLFIMILAFAQDSGAYSYYYAPFTIDDYTIDCG